MILRNKKISKLVKKKLLSSNLKGVYFKQLKVSLESLPRGTPEASRAETPSGKIIVLLKFFPYIDATYIEAGLVAITMKHYST